jgi:kynurenine formamidase
MSTSTKLLPDWNNRGGIVGRGVLLDYVSYAARHNIPFDPMAAHAITVSDLQAIAAEANVNFRRGDILLVRTGWIKWYESASASDRDKYITNGTAWIGVKSCRETLEWLWNQRFAAVAGDSIGFEVWPPVDQEWALHDHLISLWGMPIGEMWDLEKLADECEKQKRWTFLLTSAPLNTKGGVASPPNALAVM